MRAFYYFHSISIFPQRRHKTIFVIKKVNRVSQHLLTSFYLTKRCHLPGLRIRLHRGDGIQDQPQRSLDNFRRFGGVQRRQQALLPQGSLVPVRRQHALLHPHLSHPPDPGDDGHRRSVLTSPHASSAKAADHDTVTQWKLHFVLTILD